MFWGSFVVRKWFGILQDAPNSQTCFETSGDFGGKFLLILRERIWAYGEGACVGRVLGRSSLLDWG